MKKALFYLFSFILMMCGIQDNRPTLLPKNVGTTNKIIRSLGEDDPIVMHSHVHTSGGIPISGASVSLKAFGTSTPQYTGSTDSNGDYTFSAVAQGNYQYKVSKTGYYDKIDTLGLFTNTQQYDTLIAP